MSVQDASATRAAPVAAPRGNHRGWALAIIAGAQLMIVLDATIVNIALPKMQEALGLSTANLSWVLNAYTLTFGGLLLLGGRAGDILGRRRMFLVGIGLFSAASLLGGLAVNTAWLLAARALQGIGGAIASPTALSLITTNFPEGRERNRAFGVFAAVSGSGAAIGLLAGGMLTSWLSWRWVLFVNVPIALALLLLAPRFIAESERQPGRFDLGGAVTSTVGMTSLVYGFIRAAQDGWRDRWTITAFVLAAVLLAAFVAVERRHRQPVMPLRLFANRNRAASYLVMLSLAASMFSIFFFLTLFVQDLLGYSPLRAGVAFLPVSAAIIVFAQIASRALARLGPRPLMVTGGILAAAGLTLLSRISVTSGYLDGILAPMVIFGAGMGLLFVPLTINAVAGVERRDSGAASGMLNVMQQVGGSLGLSILVTVFGTASRHEQATQMARLLAQATPAQRQAITSGAVTPPPEVMHAVLAHGVSVAFQVGALFALVALVAAVVGIRGGRQTISTDVEGAAGIPV